MIALWMRWYGGVTFSKEGGREGGREGGGSERREEHLCLLGVDRGREQNRTEQIE